MKRLFGMIQEEGARQTCAAIPRTEGAYRSCGKEQVKWKQKFYWKPNAYGCGR